MSDPTITSSQSVDVVVIGGGAAGLNGALQLVRQRRSVLVLDAGHPRNAPAAHAHGMLGHDGVNPLDLLAAGRAEVEGYGGVVRRATVSAAAVVPGGFRVGLDTGESVTARRLLVATGITDQLPQIPGLAERWGRDAVHCPYCHGWEVRERPIVVIGTMPNATHQALLFSQLSDEVTLVTHAAEPNADERQLLAAAGVAVVDGPVESVTVHDDAVSGVRLADGSTVAASAIAVQSRAEVTAGFLGELGLGVQEHPSGMGQYVPAGAQGASDVPGVWLAGNICDLGAQVGPAAAQGAMAGAMINADLVMADARAGVEGKQSRGVEGEERAGARSEA